MNIINGVRTDTLTSIVDLLEQRATAHPDRLAFTFLKDGEIEVASLTYGELRDRVAAVAAHLQRSGLEGRAALLLYPPGLEFVVAFYACLYAKVVAIPAVPPRINRNVANLDGIMADADAGTILTCASQLEKLRTLYAEQDSASSYAMFATDEGVDAAAADWTRPAIDRDTVAFLQYTSGSTGSPKGVMVGHGNLLHNHELLKTFFALDANSRYVNWLPHYHDMGLIGNIMQAVYLGAPSWLMSPSAFIKRPATWLRAIGTYRATVSGAPNFAYQYCVDRIADAQLEGLDLSSWRVAYNGAEPVRASTLVAFRERFARAGLTAEALYPCYGMAEATLIISGGAVDRVATVAHYDRIALEQNRAVPVPADHENAHALVGCGRESPVNGQQIRIADPATRQFVEAGICGEIWVSSGSVCQGYLNRPELSDDIYRARAGDGERTYARSGDLGFLDRDGELFITGRIKELLIVRGRNHYPTDIEQVVQRSHAALAVDGGAAFSIEVAGQEQVVVVQEATREAATRFDLDAIVAAASAALYEAFELQLHAFVLLRPGRVPKTSSGKIQRGVARQQYLAGELQALAAWTLPVQDIDAAGPVLDDESIDLQNEELVQSWLAARIRHYLLAVPADIDPDLPLSNYGLDSSVALQMVEEISRLTRAEMEPTLLWEYPTLNALSARIVQPA